MSQRGVTPAALVFVCTLAKTAFGLARHTLPVTPEWNSLVSEGLKASCAGFVGLSLAHQEQLVSFEYFIVGSSLNGGKQ